jgi:hypothetical protein
MVAMELSLREAVRERLHDGALDLAHRKLTAFPESAWGPPAALIKHETRARGASPRSRA